MAGAMRKRGLRPALLLVAALAMPVAAALPAGPAAAAADPALGAAEAQSIAREAVLWGYPLLLMEETRRAFMAGGWGGNSVNRFTHRSTFPGPADTQVVRPNVDTLYSVMWFDVAAEPLVISVPGSAGRYWMLQLLDMWTDSFAVPGTRTSGNGPFRFAITPPGWSGALPAGVVRLPAPTPQGWIIGRTYSSGGADLDGARAFQQAMDARPLSAVGKADWRPPAVAKPAPAAGPNQAGTAGLTPPRVIDSLAAGTFLARLADATAASPPHLTDGSVLMRLARLGFVPGQLFALETLSPDLRLAVEAGHREAMAQIQSARLGGNAPRNGWRTATTDIGTYGNSYAARAGVAFGGLGANPPADAIYPTAVADAGGQPFDSAARYRIRFPKGTLPPVNAFWSLTLYNADQYLAANPANRYAIESRDPLVTEPDGSTILLIQRDPPPGREANWLPTPASGPFSLTFRLYWPRAEALDGRWVPPAVERVP